MSMVRRPRVITNGAQRTRTNYYFWCRRCERAVRIYFTYPYEASCPHCLGQLRHASDLSRPRLMPNVSRIDRNLLDSLAEMLQNTNFDWRIRGEPENDRMIFQFANPTPLPRLTSPNENTTPSITTPRTIPDGDQDDVPAPVSVIQNLEKVILTQTHLDNDPHCPVCKEEFEIGVEVKIMPCKHFYHPECIDPWLRIKNTCPVCRYELPLPPYEDDIQDDDTQDADIETLRFDDFRESLSWTWDRLLSLWPFRLFSNSQYHEFNFEYDNEANPWWRSWLIL